MATTLTSAIINVNISKLKKDLEAPGDIKVKSITPKNGATSTAVVLTRGDGSSNLLGAQVSAAQAVLDAHTDLQDEDVKLIGRDNFSFGNKQVGTVDIHNAGTAVWRIDASNHLLPVTGSSFNIGSPGSRVNIIYGVTGNFSGDLAVSGSLTVSGTLTTINTANLDISDNIIRLNSGVTGAPTLDSGILIERGTSTDAEIIWNETTDKFQAGITTDLQNLIRQTEFDTHVNNVSNPHSVTKTQVGLSAVTNDAQLKRAAGDFASFTAKTIPISADIFLIEDSAAAHVKKYVTFGQINSNLVHQNLSGAGTNTHTQIDSHIADTANPHTTTKTQVGLSNVTNDAQLKRSANDFSSFTIKVTPTTSDLLLIEDAAAGGDKKYVSIASLPFSSAGSLDGFPLPSTPSDKDTVVFNGALSQWDYTEAHVAKKIVTGLGNKSFDATSIPDDQEYLKYDSGLDKIVWSAAPGVSSSGPIGSILPFGGSLAPQGFLLADGSAISRTFYADLFAVIGTTFGVGDGSTTFNIPNMGQRFPLGKAVSGTGNTLGASGGAIDHNHTLSTSATGLSGGPLLVLTSTSTDNANPPYLVTNYIIKYSDNLLVQGTTNISNDINLTGILSQRTHTGFAGSEVIRKTFGYQTTTGTQSAALTLALPDATVTHVEVKIAARYENTSTNKSYVARIFGGVRRNGGGLAALIDSPEIADLIAENISLYDVDLGVSGNSLTILVTGASGETVNWTGTIEYQSASLAS